MIIRESAEEGDHQQKHTATLNQPMVLKVCNPPVLIALAAAATQGAAHQAFQNTQSQRVLVLNFIPVRSQHYHGSGVTLTSRNPCAHNLDLLEWAIFTIGLHHAYPLNNPHATLHSTKDGVFAVEPGCWR
jgi:hypothetical protein